MKRFILNSVMLLFAVSAVATPVSQERTQQIANFFFHERGGQGNLRLVGNSKSGHLLFYGGENGKGFVIMSSDDCVFPILGYSVDNRIDLQDMGENTRAWLEGYDNQIEWHINNNHETSGDVSDEWERLEKMIPSPQMAPATDSTINTANLLTTKWAQTPYYNAHCPYNYSTFRRTVTGCTATSMAQIMKYWGFPERGVGRKSYVLQTYGTQSAFFSDTIFNYAAMPDSLTASSTADEINAVATLMYCCGISVHMRYAVSGSAAYVHGDGSYGFESSENAFKEFFKYKHTLHSVAKGDYTDAEWLDLLRNEINHGRPVQYESYDVNEASGHAFVCCGYDNTDKLYFNWGWGGADDGYYRIGQLNPGYDFNYNNTAVIGIEPDTTGAETTLVMAVSDNPSEGTVTGTGVYTSYQDIVTIEATPKPGYIFRKWDDNTRFSRYSFLANMDTVVHTAYFEKVTDTVRYCYDGFLNRDEKGLNKSFWGMYVDSNYVAPQRRLTKVNVYIHDPGTYMVHIFKGVISNQTKVHSDTAQFGTEDACKWVTIPLSTPVSMDRNNKLWIVMESPTTYPMTYSSYRGVTNGSYYSRRLYDSWNNNVTDNSEYISYMIKGIFEYDPSASGVEDVAVEKDELTLYADDQGVVIENGEGKEIEIYDAAGKMVACKCAGSDYEIIRLVSGVYFVRVEGKAGKVVVR